MNCDKYSVIFSKNKTNGIQAELLNPNFVLNMLVLSYICIVVDVLFHFCEELAYTLHSIKCSYNLRVSIYAMSVIIDLPTFFFICIGSDKS